MTFLVFDGQYNFIVVKKDLLIYFK